MSKKLLTFLGVGYYEKTKYIMNEKIAETAYIQEALAKILNDKMEFIILLTEKARRDKWEREDESVGSIKEILDENGIMYRTVDIYDGRNEEEMWRNFDIIFSQLEDNDEVSIDITHSFRSIPIIFISVLNYARFIKSIELQGIYYGAFDPTSKEKTPIYDLSIFNKIMEWSEGANKLISTGDGEQFAHTIKNTVVPILRETEGGDKNLQHISKTSDNLEKFGKDIKASRGLDISKSGRDLKECLSNIKNTQINKLKPFEQIIDKVYEKVDGYKDESIIEDIHHTVKLCRDYGLIQQAYTFLTENIINYVCEKVDLSFNNSYISKEYRKKSREHIASDIIYKHLEGDKKQLDKYISKKYEESKKLMNKEMAELYREISNIRNDIDHAGYRENKSTYDNFKEQLDNHIERFEELFLNKL
ncbi:TIGR02221 family CRISPR-associated protein [Clostridium sp. D2Q-14]|uniref:TIGR02221 family CRISPR-associated protein n=1 Tax=Anaeromonas gelatinilytica TaxID=2683194 RepID=UPI00193C16D0|nr:TIGR02221 family CRISPR-associated protein [Anaeromonas gelatinilytica]MBS4534148.1 TIGR02221 family CRISPR-associated protein [Anaeromonas gelatinilytica]